VPCRSLACPDAGFAPDSAGRGPHDGAQRGCAPGRSRPGGFLGRQVGLRGASRRRWAAVERRLFYCEERPPETRSSTTGWARGATSRRPRDARDSRPQMTHGSDLDHEPDQPRGDPRRRPSAQANLRPFQRGVPRDPPARRRQPGRRRSRDRCGALGHLPTRAGRSRCLPAAQGARGVGARCRHSHLDLRGGSAADPRCRARTDRRGRPRPDPPELEGDARVTDPRPGASLERSQARPRPRHRPAGGGSRVRALEAIIREGAEKRAAVAASVGPERRLHVALVLPPTRHHKSLVASHPRIVTAAYPAAQRDLLQALTTSAAPWPGDGILWVAPDRALVNPVRAQ